jgi:hypothetical protein
MAWLVAAQKKCHKTMPRLSNRQCCIVVASRGEKKAYEKAVKPATE